MLAGCSLLLPLVSTARHRGVRSLVHVVRSPRDHCRFASPPSSAAAITPDSRVPQDRSIGALRRTESVFVRRRSTFSFLVDFS